jgi:hypothetical protein
MSAKPAELFNADAATADELGVDRASKIIVGCKIMQLGELNDDRPMFADRDTLENVVEFMGQPKKGIKARFTHNAALGGDGLNTHLGRWVNPRIDGDSVRADLQLAAAAEISPVGNLADFVMTLAAEDPESFGVSVAGVLDPAMFEDQEKTIHPIRFSRIWSADFVGDPAATRGGLFSKSEISEENPVSENLETPAVELEPVLDVPTEEQPVELSAAAATVHNLRDDAKPFVEAFGNQGAAWFLEGKNLEECFREQNASLAEKLETIETQLNAAIDALAKFEAENGEAEPLSVSQELTAETAAAILKREKNEQLRAKGASASVAKWTQIYN